MKNAVKKVSCLFLLCCAWIFPHSSSAQESLGFVIVVNSANPSDEIDRKLAGKLFLRQVKSWSHGVDVAPVDQDPKSEVREAFTRKVHGKKVSSIKSYWQRMIFSGRAAPPPELDSDASVLDFVRGDPGGIGYVLPGADLGDGVKTLKLVE